CELLGRLRLELVADNRVITDNLRLVAGFDHVRLARPDLNHGAVLMSDPHRSRLQNAQMFQLAAIPSHHRLDALSPRPPRLERKPSRSCATQVHNIRPCLVRCPALVGRVEAALLDTSHPDLLRLKSRPRRISHSDGDLL